MLSLQGYSMYMSVRVAMRVPRGVYKRVSPGVCACSPRYTSIRIARRSAVDRIHAGHSASEEVIGRADAGPRFLEPCHLRSATRLVAG